MISMAAIRNEFLEELWLPLIIEGGIQFYPALRKNKKMKTLVFTDESLYQEIITIINARITNEDNVFAWTDTLFKTSRLQTYRPVKVVGSSRFEDSAQENIITLSSNFPFDILSIDFSCQNVQDEPQRLEKELDCIEQIIKVQREKISIGGFVLFYTTFLGSHPLSSNEIKQSSDSIRIENWNGLSTNILPNNAISDDDKMKVIECTIFQFAQKHRLTVNLKKRVSNFNPNNKKLYSIGGIFKVV